MTDKSNRNALIFPILAYIPIVGWMIPLYLDTRNEYSQFHGKQGFVINRMFLLIFIVWWILRNFVPTHFDELYSYSIWGLIIIYLVILLAGAVIVLQGKEHLPYFGRSASEVRL